MRIFVSNFPYETSAADLRALFSQFGRVADLQVMRDRETGRSRGFGFVEMPDREQAEKAISALAGVMVGGRALRVKEADAPRNPNAGFRRYTNV